MFRISFLFSLLLYSLCGFSQNENKPSFLRSASDACSTRYFFKYYSDSQREILIEDLIELPGGDWIICGSGRIPGVGSPSYIMRTDANGLPVWEMNIDLNAITGNHCVDIELLADGNLLVLGYILELGPLTFFMVKITPGGSVLWRIDFQIGNASSFRKPMIREDTDGSIYLVGSFLESLSFTYRSYLLRFDNAGNLIYNHIYYRTPTLSVIETNDCLLLGDHIYIVGSHIPSWRRGMFLKINKSDGSLVGSRSYDYNGGEAFFTQLFPYENNRLCIIGTDDLNATDSLSVMITDLDGNILSSRYSVSGGPHDHGRATIDATGEIMWAAYWRDDPDQPPVMSLTNINPITGTNWIKLYPEIPGFSRAQNITYIADGSLVIAGYITLGSLNSPMRGYIGKFTKTGEYGCPPAQIPFSTGPLSVQVENHDFTRAPVNVTMLNRSPLFVSSVITEIDSICYMQINCDTLFLTQPQPVCDLSATIEIEVGVTPGCTIPPSFIFDQTHLSLQSFSNNIALFSILREGQSQVKAILTTNCEVFEDSVDIMTFDSRSLDLGPDTTICPGNEIVLDAGDGFEWYQWQDASQGSVFQVQSPGTYYVDTRDFCGNMFTDTVIVSAAPPPFLDIGPDRIKCNDDSVHLAATPGFLNYTWSPGYNISTQAGQQVIVYPSVDTAYTLIAEHTPGCFAFDTVYITVLRSPPLDLGPDISFCSGDSITLNTGPGFLTYQWNTGASSQQLVVYTQGNYSVIATDANGCSSFDTLRVINVFANPVVSLGNDSTLCMGRSRTLDAGAGFLSYIWNTGSNAQILNISSPGIYEVTVTDQNGCSSFASAIINTVLPSPAGFLPPDTVICSYGNLLLIPDGFFNQYQWNTGSSQPSLTVTSPGTYWLSVTGSNGCSGTDSVRVSLKDCLSGFYIPSAFTPNNDGKNDIFRPLLFGNVIHYQFNIYNRWGQLVFSTSRLDQGWNGVFNGTPQDANVFIWHCIYQFEGGEKKAEKGTVTLVR